MQPLLPCPGSVEGAVQQPAEVTTRGRPAPPAVEGDSSGRNHWSLPQMTPAWARPLGPSPCLSFSRCCLLDITEDQSQHRAPVPGVAWACPPWGTPGSRPSLLTSLVSRTLSGSG